MTAVSVAASAADLGSYKDAPVEEHGAGRTLAVTGYAALTSDYIFRGFSQSDNEPALQAQVDITYGLFYAGVFSSSTELGFDDSIEIDVYGGIKPTWNGVTFDLGIIYYAYPGSEVAGDDLEYLEFKAGVSGKLLNIVDAYVNIYYTEDGTLTTEEVWTVEGGISKTLFTHRNIAFSASAALGYVDGEDDTTVVEYDDYTYWNLGVTATLKEKYSLDVRYHDTDVDNSGYHFDYLADERVVVTGKVSF